MSHRPQRLEGVAERLLGLWPCAFTNTSAAGACHPALSGRSPPGPDSCLCNDRNPGQTCLGPKGMLRPLALFVLHLPPPWRGLCRLSPARGFELPRPQLPAQQRDLPFSWGVGQSPEAGFEDSGRVLCPASVNHWPG